MIERKWLPDVWRPDEVEIGRGEDDLVTIY